MLEMLTVVGIIVLLIAILLPVVSRVRTQAATAATQNQMNQIGAAIERYRGDNNAFPGILPNSYFGNNGLASVGGVNITMTENAVLSLCGGLDPDANSNSIPPAATYHEESVGLGPMTQVANPMRRKRLPAYLDPTPRQMMPDKPWSANGKTSAADSVVPEFMDRYQVSKPILYMRANVGAQGVIPNWPQGTQVAGAQYVPDQWLAPYGWTLTTVKSADFPLPSNAPGGMFAEAVYFAHPTVSPNFSIARGKDTYLLISAGPDNVYGTKDDNVYP
jgi:type II secretory pathway pseudopilin PulG